MNTILSKILTEEATLFFKFLQENKVIDTDSKFEYYYEKYISQGYSDGHPVYNQLSQDIETLLPQTNNQKYITFYRETKQILKSQYPQLPPKEIKQKIIKLWKDQKNTI